MRRIPLVLIIVLLLFGALHLYFLIAKPVIILPPYTVALSEDNPIFGIRRFLGVDQLDITLRTNGRVALAGDGQRFAYLSYNFGSLINTAELAGRLVLPPLAIPITAGAFLVLLLLFPQIIWGTLLVVLYLYFVIPVEITLRLIHG